MRTAGWTVMWLSTSLMLGACHHHSASEKVRSSAQASARPASAAALPSVSASGGGAAQSGPDASFGTAQTAPDAGSGKVKLLASGKAPRTRLRYRFAVGHVEPFTVTTWTTISVGAAGQVLNTIAVPGVELDTSVRVLGLARDGAARRALKIHGATVLDPADSDQNVVALLRQRLQAFDKLSVHDEMTRRGIVRAVSFNTRSISDPQTQRLMKSLKSAFGLMSVPFPRQAVGVGARWEVDTEVVQQGMHLMQAATYELTRLKGSRGSTRVTLTQTAPGGTLKAPGLPSGVSAKLLSIHSKGGGRLDFNLRRMAPAGQLQTHSDVRVRTQKGNRSQNSDMQMSLRVEFRSGASSTRPGAHDAGVITKP